MHIVDVAGGVDLKTAPLLRQLLFEVLGQAPKVAVNLAAVSFIESSGVAVLLEALLESQRRHGQFVLFGMNPAVRDDFRITHVAKVFQVVDIESKRLPRGGFKKLRDDECKNQWLKSYPRSEGWSDKSRTVFGGYSYPSTFQTGALFALRGHYLRFAPERCHLTIPITLGNIEVPASLHADA